MILSTLRILGYSKGGVIDWEERGVWFFLKIKGGKVCNVKTFLFEKFRPP
jgi:hypothetical protein